MESGKISFGGGVDNLARSAEYIAKARRKCAFKPDDDGRIMFGSPWLLGRYMHVVLRMLVLLSTATLGRLHRLAGNAYLIVSIPSY